MAATLSGSGATADRIECGTADVPANTPTFSAMGWGKTASVTEQRLLSKATGLSADNHTWMVGLIDTPSDLCRTRINAGGSTTTVAAGAVTTGVYAHTAVIYDGTNQTNYTNAVSQGSAANSGDVEVDASAEYWIGNQPPTGTTSGQIWDGDLEDIRVYARDISVAELECIINSNGHDGIVHEMILRHPLNDNSSGTIGTGATRARGIGSLQQDGDGVNGPTWQVGENIMAPRRRYR